MDLTSNSGPLAGYVAVLTGAAGLVGQVLARGIAEAGASVALLDRAAEPVETLAAELTAEGCSVIALEADLRDPASLEAAVAAVTERWGRIDGLVNNAAYMSEEHRRPFETFSAEEWRNLLDVNVIGTVSMIQVCLPWLRERGGSVVNIGSSTTLNGARNLAPYVTGKSALTGLTRACAREFGDDDIRVNVVLPGLVDGRQEPGSEDRMPPGLQAALDGRALRRPMRPGDLLGTVVHLLSDGSAFVTGQTFNVDGGFNLH